MTLHALIARADAGEDVDFLFFWGHTPPEDDAVGPHVLSQWWPARFVVDEVAYESAEHYMMAAKARLFGDDDALAKILATSSPRVAKRIGRTVRHFAEHEWKAHRSAIVRRASVAKFQSDPTLRDYLLGTGERVLVEASPVDAIWGIGLASTDPRARRPRQWRGYNLLGFALMEARAELRLDHSSQSEDSV